MGRLVRKVTFRDHSQWTELAQLAGFNNHRLAELIGLSRRQVERYIKRHFAVTPHRWLRELRMARAGELIRVMHSVKEVAYALGFTQVSTFCHQFKAHHGMTCSQYAAMIANRECPPVPRSDSRVAAFRSGPVPGTTPLPQKRDVAIAS